MVADVRCSGFPNLPCLSSRLRGPPIGDLSIPVPGNEDGRDVGLDLAAVVVAAPAEEHERPVNRPWRGATDFQKVGDVPAPLLVMFAPAGMERRRSGGPGVQRELGEASRPLSKG